MVVGSNAYTELGASSNLSYNTNNRTLTVPATTITNTTAAVSSTTGALRVAGGVGIGGNLYVGGEIVASKLTIELTTVTTTLIVTDDIIQTLNETQSVSSTTGALIVAGGAGIRKNLYVGGTIFGNLDGFVTDANTATNIRNGTIGQVPFQQAPGLTNFFGPGTAGQLLISQGVSATGPVFVNTGSIYVGRAALADDLTGGLVGSLPYQNGVNSTVFLNLGTEGNILLAGASAPRWGTLAEIVAGEATTATHIKFGTVNQIPYQTAVGRTSFFGPGTAGQLLVSNGISAGGPVFTTTSSIYVGRAALADDLVGGTTGALPYQTGTNDTVFLSLGTLGNVLTAGALGPIWSSLDSISAGEATTATHIKFGTAGQVPYQTAPGRTGFFGPGTTGQVMMSGGTSGPFYLNTSSLYVGRARYADELIGGTVGALPYQSAVNDTSFLALGTTGHILVARAGGPVWESADGLSAGNANTSSNIALGTVNQVPYQTAPGTTNFFGPGTAGQLLVSNGTNLGGPVFTNTSSIYVGRAALADDLVGGTAGSLPYQNAADSTIFLALGSNGTVLTAGATGPEWTALSGLSAGTTANIGGGTANQIPYQTAPGATNFFGPGTAGQLLVSNGTTAGGPVFTNTSTIYVGRSALADDLVGGATGSLPYQDATNNTTFLSLGTNGFVLTAGATSPVWTALSGLSAGTTSNINGGTANQIPYQTAPGATNFFGPGTAGQLLVSNGTTAGGPVFTNTGSIYVGRAALADDLVGGTVGQVPYQSATNTTDFYGPGTAGQLLVSAGAAAPVYTNTSSIYVGRAVLADDLFGGTANQILYQVGANDTGFVVAPTVAATYLQWTGSGFTWTSSTGPVGPSGPSGPPGDPFGGGTFNGKVTIRVGGVNMSVGNSSQLEISNAANGACNISFHREGAYGAHFGLNTDNWFSTLGWSAGSGYTNMRTGTLIAYGEIQATSEITAYASDKRLKTDIRPIENAVEKVKSLNGVIYKWNELAGTHGFDQTKDMSGVLAQEVEAVFPEVIRLAPFDSDIHGNSISGENYKTVQYEKIVPLLIEAIKELSLEIEELKKKIG
jgi:hypothetical protein